LNRRQLSVLVLSIAIVSSFLIIPVHADNWLSGWTNRKAHVIHGSTGAGANYQIPITTHYGGGSDSGGDVYLSFASNTDFGDVRFTDNDGLTLLPYWRETYVSSDYALFWIKVSANLDSDTQIYVYYGNPSVNTTSSLNDTFIRDINGSQLAQPLDENTGIYTYDKSGNGNNGTLSGVVLPTWTTGRYGYGLYFTENSINYSYLIDANAKNLPNNATDDWTISMWVYPAPQAAFACLAFGSLAPPPGTIRAVISFNNELYSWGVNADWNTKHSFASGWQNIVVTCNNGTSVMVYMDGGYIDGGNLNPSILVESSPNIWTFAYKEAAFYLDYYIGKADELRIYDKILSPDEISDLYANHGYDTLNYPHHTLVRKYISPEPTNGAWGNSETAGITASGVFTELFYGAGSWLGLLIILAIVIVLSLQTRYAGLLMLPVCVFLGITYLGYPALMWNAVIVFFAAIFIMVNLVKSET